MSTQEHIFYLLRDATRWIIAYSTCSFISQCQYDVRVNLNNFQHYPYFKDTEIKCFPFVISGRLLLKNTIFSFRI